MSQPVGYQYKSRIPSFSDDASIVEALKVYHYGVDNWTTEPIPDDSIEGNFRSINDALAGIQSQLLTLNYVQLVSQSSSPNVITGQSTTTVPITIRSIASQTAALQQWQNSSSVSVGSISTGGFINFAGYVTAGSTTQSTTTGLDLTLSNSGHKGIVVKAQSGQSANIQEWVIGGSTVSYVDNTGRIFSNNIQVATLSGSETLTNKILSNPITIIGISTPATTGGEYEISLSDRDRILEFSSTTTVRVPSNDVTAFPVGSTVSILQTGSGQITTSAQIGINPPTINATPGNKTRAQWSLVTLVKRGTNSWVLFGDSVA